VSGVVARVGRVVVHHEECATSGFVASGVASCGSVANRSRHMLLFRVVAAPASLVAHGSGLACGRGMALLAGTSVVVQPGRPSHGFDSAEPEWMEEECFDDVMEP